MILDVVASHAGDVFADPAVFDPRWDGREYPVAGWRTPGGLVPFTAKAAAAAVAGRRGAPGRAAPAGGLHPARADRRLGPLPRVRRGRLRGLKDIAHGGGGLDDYRPSPALVALARAYCWWIGYADLDGFRIDTVKHMEAGRPGTSRRSSTSSRSRSGRTASCWSGRSPGRASRRVATMEVSRARRGAVGLEVQSRLVGAATGAEDPARYFALFRNSELIGKDSHTWLRDTVVTGFDDHDLIRQGAARRGWRRRSRAARWGRAW